MAERGGFVYIDPVQSEVLYQEFLKRTGETEPGTFNGGRLQSGADRCLQMAQQERGDIVLDVLQDVRGIDDVPDVSTNISFESSLDFFAIR